MVATREATIRSRAAVMAERARAAGDAASAEHLETEKSDKSDKSDKCDLFAGKAFPIEQARRLALQKRRNKKAVLLPMVAAWLDEGHSRRAIARALGVSHTTINRWAKEVACENY